MVSSGSPKRLAKKNIKQNEGTLHTKTWQAVGFNEFWAAKSRKERKGAKPHPINMYYKILYYCILNTHFSVLKFGESMEMGFA